jgi:membrane-associated phospholipid phosphatase
MTLWLAAALLVAGIPALMVDRYAALYFREHLSLATLMRIQKTTDWAKGGPWLIGVAVVYLAAQIGLEVRGETQSLRWANDVALALFASLVVGSIALHTVKLFLGRRRPRDDFEHGLYGFVFFTWSLQYNSFPSGHALTIFCVATWASALAPPLAPLWYAIAFYLALTRALLAVHFLSDVLIGAAIGIFATRETLVLAFPQLAPAWF